MGNARIYWTPRGESGEVYLDLTTLGGLFRFAGFSAGTGHKSVSRGGKTCSVIHDTGFVYHVEVRGVSRTADPDTWCDVSSFVSHADAGGEFAFKLDSDKDDETTLNGAVAKGATSIVLTSGSWVANGDLLFLEDADDETKWEIRRVSDASGSPTIVLAKAVTYGFASGSVVRDWEFFPKCLAIGDVSWKEREGGRGANRWDLVLRLRTVR